ncbi:hypothetical protein LCGC14_1941070 [marine sediment metagenome]|uniref:Ribbon-helix-helix protein CopG domain-containing protein n=1 Tax=marine sediment metagenome TaxID=412755 RepID=A0A0F9IHK7_9ZZZZ
MVRPKLSAAEKRSHPIFVLLRPRERRAVEKIARVEQKSKGAVLRDAFLEVHGARCRPPVR